MKTKTRLQKAIVISLVLCLFASITLTVGAAFTDGLSGQCFGTITDPAATPTDGILGFFTTLIQNIIAFFSDLFGGVIC